MDNNKQEIVGKTKTTGFQVGARKTFPLSLEEGWNLITSHDGLKIWLGDIASQSLKQGMRYRLENGISGKVTVFVPLSHIRLTWHPEEWPRPSVIQVRVIPNGQKTVIAFHQEHLPGPKEREERKAFFKNVLKQFEAVINNI